MHRQRREVGVVAGKHDLLHRRLGPAQFDDLRLAGKPARDLGREPLRCHPECAGKARAARQHIAGQFLPLRPDGVEVHGLHVAVENRRDIGHIDRRFAHLDLAGAGEIVEEAAQAEAIKIVSWNYARTRPLDRIHGRPLANFVPAGRDKPCRRTRTLRRHPAGAERRPSVPYGTKAHGCAHPRDNSRKRLNTIIASLVHAPLEQEKPGQESQAAEGPPVLKSGVSITPHPFARQFRFLLTRLRLLSRSQRTSKWKAYRCPVKRTIPSKPGSARKRLPCFSVRPTFRAAASASSWSMPPSREPRRPSRRRPRPGRLRIITAGSRSRCSIRRSRCKRCGAALRYTDNCSVKYDRVSDVVIVLGFVRRSNAVMEALDR